MPATPHPLPLTTVTAGKGNLVRQTDCNGIVNLANPQIIAGSGVCGAIYAAAGPRLEPVSRLLAPLQLGEAVVSDELLRLFSEQIAAPV